MSYYLKLAAALLVCIYAVFSVPADAASLALSSQGGPQESKVLPFIR